MVERMNHLYLLIRLDSAKSFINMKKLFITAVNKVFIIIG